MAAQDTKLVNIVVVGHVDHGKSTLIGRLLIDAGKVTKERAASVEKLCQEKGMNFEPAFLLDGFEEERQQGITIDTTRVYCEFDGKQFCLIDAPGHVEFFKNMATAASYADAGVLVVDCNQGACAQTVQHLRMLAMIGVRNVVVVANKMDSVNYNQAEYDKVCAAVDEIIKQEKLVRIAAVPVSAYNGVNLFKPAEKEMPWYSGKPLVSALCDIEQQLTAQDEHAEQFRMVLQDVYRFGEERCYAGRVTSGQIHAGSEILFSPSAKRTVIKEIKKSDTQSVTDASKGNSIALTLHDEIFVERGEVISLPNEMPEIETEFHSRIIWLGKDDYEPNQEYLIKIGTAESKCSIESITELSNGIFADVVIRTQRPLAFDNAGSGISNFVICSKWETAAAGVVLEQLPLAIVPVLKSRHVSKETDYVEQHEFEKQYGHKGAVVWLTGLSGAGKSTLAKHLERQLFSRGSKVVVLDADNLRHGLCADLGFSATERSENVRRIAQVAKMLVNAGNIVIVACISPYKKDREAARQIIGTDSFLEVFVFCPLEVCRQRDPKGLYAKSSRGELNELSGIGAPYQPPVSPALRINTEVTEPNAAESMVMNLLEEAQIIGEVNVVAKTASWVR